MKIEQIFMWLILILVFQSLFIKSRRNKILASQMSFLGSEPESMCKWTICSPLLNLGVYAKRLPVAQNGNGNGNGVNGNGVNDIYTCL
jgi:hypothetical protein